MKRLATLLPIACLLAGATALPAAAQSGRYVPPPPIVLSPNLTEPWVAQLTPGTIPIYPRPGTVRLPNADPQPSAVATPAVATGHITLDGKHAPLDPALLPQEVDYQGSENAGTIVIDTTAKFLYLVEQDGKARRYGVGVGRPGFTWSGVHHITRKAEWPDWHPPVEMRQRQPNLPVMMPGGPRNPLGARAMYLGSTLYRIHGTAEPWTIGHAVSSGCIRMRNEDVTDLYSRVKVGTTVIVM
ncbi:L,D-transpeptidase [Oryzibacter oryziterrae]|uniref:L,D-transpeptidase n=1 Tax=Oryzibacter oryziterrae TaxID=2766474 RepID=UPI001F424F34|nr:L,D-transpeptidase [Oryzibacter oryziterrae]